MVLFLGDQKEEEMKFSPAAIIQILGLLDGVGHNPPEGVSSEALKVAGRDDSQDARIAGLEVRVATLERALRLMLEARK